MRLIWVTGAHGFLGRHLCRHLSKSDYKVVGIGHGHWLPGEALKWGINTWIFSDITLPALEGLEDKTAKPYAIFHIAGSGSVQMSISNPYLDFQRTVGTSLDVLEYIRLRSSETKLIYPSSAAVYGSVQKGKISEDMDLAPVSPYGAHKKIAETLCRSYTANFGIDISIIRFFSLYGNGLAKQLLWDMCCKLHESKKDILLYGTGEETRDWLHVEDAVSLLVKAMERASSKVECVNGGTGIGTTVKEIAEELRKYFDASKKITFNNLVRKGDPRFYQADTKMTEEWGWKPERDLKNGIKEYVEWFKGRDQLQ